MTTKQDVLACYEETGTMLGVSQKLGISPDTVRRVLISNGIFPSKRVKEMTRLRMMGLTDDEIATYLRVKIKTVKKYTPYSRGSYVLGERTLNAERIAQCRERKGMIRRKNRMSRTAPRDMGNASPIATARIAAGLTQVQLAEMIGCNVNAITRWENGQFAPKGQNLLKLAAALKCDPQKLL